MLSKVATTAAATKTSRKHLRNGDYFGMIAYCSLIDEKRCKCICKSAVLVNIENVRITVVYSRCR